VEDEGVYGGGCADGFHHQPTDHTNRRSYRTGESESSDGMEDVPCRHGTEETRREGGEGMDGGPVWKYGGLRIPLRTGWAGHERGKSQETGLSLSDGLRANCQICLDHSPVALQILDFYHASEHVAEFCNLYRNLEKGQRRYEQWYPMLVDG
jgi:hypothetical protein